MQLLEVVNQGTQLKNMECVEKGRKENIYDKVKHIFTNDIIIFKNTNMCIGVGVCGGKAIHIQNADYWCRL